LGFFVGRVKKFKGVIFILNFLGFFLKTKTNEFFSISKRKMLLNPLPNEPKDLFCESDKENNEFPLVNFLPFPY